MVGELSVGNPGLSCQDFSGPNNALHLTDWEALLLAVSQEA